MNTINGTEAQTITSPQGASPLAGEGENRPTTHDEIEFFHNILTEARKTMDIEHIEKFAKEAGFEFFNKLSDPPIPCFSGTVKQLEKFVRLIFSSTPY